MADALDQYREPAPAGDAPAVIHLPYEPPPTPGEKQRPKRHRGHVEQFRTDADEHAVLAALAREAGLSLGAYYRRELIGTAGLRAKRAPPTAASQQRAQHITAINRAGNLINQGIRSLNETALRAPEAGMRDRLADEIAAARELLQSAIPALKAALAAAVADDVRES